MRRRVWSSARRPAVDGAREASGSLALELELGERRELEHRARLQQLGTLAAGIAHELGTPLQLISGHAALVAERCVGDAELERSSAVILERRCSRTHPRRDDGLGCLIPHPSTRRQTPARNAPARPFDDAPPAVNPSLSPKKRPERSYARAGARACG